MNSSIILSFLLFLFSSSTFILVSLLLSYTNVVSIKLYMYLSSLLCLTLLNQMTFIFIILLGNKLILLLFMDNWTQLFKHCTFYSLIVHWLVQCWLHNSYYFLQNEHEYGLVLLKTHSFFAYILTISMAISIAILCLVFEELQY